MGGSLLSPLAQEGVSPATQWTVVRGARNSRATAEQAQAALAELCRIYWRPVCHFIRQKGNSQADAQDLTREFFAKLIATRAYVRADPAKDRFRSFLLRALKHSLADSCDSQQAQKRGGRVVFTELNDATISEAETQAVRSGDSSPDRIYVREWAAAVLRRRMERLAAESALGGRSVLFEAFKSHLRVSALGSLPYAELALRFARPTATLRSDVGRFCARYRALLREEVRATVGDEFDVDDELRYRRELLAS